MLDTVVAFIVAMGAASAIFLVTRLRSVMPFIAVTTIVFVAYNQAKAEEA